MKRTRTASRDRLARKLAAYSLATGTGLVAANSVDAAVVPMQLSAPLVFNAALTDPDDVIDINGDNRLDFYFNGDYWYNGDLDRYQGHFSLSGYLSLNRIFESAPGSYLAKIFASGESIGTDTLSRFAEFSAQPTRGYVGFVFDIPGGSPHFGYLDVGISGAEEEIFTIYGGAYESQANTPILAGAVPEPTGLALLACGASSLGLWRRRS